LISIIIMNLVYLIEENDLIDIDQDCRKITIVSNDGQIREVCGDVSRLLVQ